MTSTVTQRTIDAITSQDWSSLSITIALVATLLVFCVMLLRELVTTASESDARQRWMGALNFVALPLLVMFAFVIIMRILDLMGVR